MSAWEKKKQKQQTIATGHPGTSPGCYSSIHRSLRGKLSSSFPLNSMADPQPDAGTTNSFCTKQPFSVKHMFVKSIPVHRFRFRTHKKEFSLPTFCFQRVPSKAQKTRLGRLPGAFLGLPSPGIRIFLENLRTPRANGSGFWKERRLKRMDRESTPRALRNTLSGLEK